MPNRSYPRIRTKLWMQVVWYCINLQLTYPFEPHLTKWQLSILIGLGARSFLTYLLIPCCICVSFNWDKNGFYYPSQLTVPKWPNAFTYVKHIVWVDIFDLEFCRLNSTSNIPVKIRSECVFWSRAYLWKSTWK